MQALRRSVWLSAAALLLVGLSTLGDLQHQIAEVRSDIVEPDSVVSADCEPGQELHLDPAARVHHDCVVCRLGSTILKTSPEVGVSVAAVSRPLASGASRAAATLWFQSSPTRAPPVR